MIKLNTNKIYVGYFGEIPDLCKYIRYNDYEKSYIFQTNRGYYSLIKEEISNKIFKYYDIYDKLSLGDICYYVCKNDIIEIKYLYLKFEINENDIKKYKIKKLHEKYIFKDIWDANISAGLYNRPKWLMKMN